MTWDSDREAGAVAAVPVAAHMAPPASSYMNFASTELKFLEKPFASEPGTESISSDEGPSRRKSRVEFRKREAATAPELFYDLWFVANLTVFSSANPITELQTLYIFIAYFVLLWTTWFVTSVYVVRFGQDGVLARMGFACHLGSLVGFTLLGISFGKENLLPNIMKITCITMAVSRLVLSLQYGVALFQARAYAKTRIPVLVAVLLHFVPGLLYLIVGLTISLKRSGDYGYVLVVWCVVAVFELVSVLAHSALSTTLSFEGTHMRERFNVLTLIVLGEGASILTKNITVIMEFTYIKDITPHWSPPLIGTIFCSTAILYLCYMLYFDWMHQHNHMKRVPQAFWSFMHLPFHCVLILLAEGTGQWGIMWRATEALAEISAVVDERVLAAASSENITAVADVLQNVTLSVMTKYGVDTSADQKVIADAINGVRLLPDSILVNGLNATERDTFLNATSTVGNILQRVVVKAFSISVGKTATEVATTVQNADERAIVEAGVRQLLVMSYLFIAAGLVLILLMVLHLISKRKGWSIFNIARTSVVMAIGIGLCLVALVNVNIDALSNFVDTPWQLPIIVSCFFVVLVITHLPHPQRFLEMFKKK